jgi:hypothetical protein
MTEWGMLLLCAYIALGATGRLTRRQAGTVALALTVTVIGVAMVSYSRSTPQDKYIPFVDATVYQTGRPSQTSTQPFSTREDVTGVQAANWFTTNHNSTASGGSSAGGGG